MKKRFRRGKSLLSMVLTIILLTVWMIPSSILPVGAAVVTLTPGYRYVAATDTHEIFWPAPSLPGLIRCGWHDAAGAVVTIPDQTDPDAVGSLFRYTLENGVKTAVLELPLGPDHIYDLDLRVYSDTAGTNQTGQARPYVLTGMTFEGESFDETANNLIDNNPQLEDMNGNILTPPAAASTVVSGLKPVMRLRWKVPTVYTSAGVQYLTERMRSEWKTALRSTVDPVNISESGFYFTMNKGRNTTVAMEFNALHSSDVSLRMTGATIDPLSVTPPAIQGLDPATGRPLPANDGFVWADLTKECGIESGTEFEDVSMGLVLWNGTAKVSLSDTALLFGKANINPVLNTDKAFAKYGPLTSIFTPMEYEMSKVDENKVEIRFRKVTNGRYTKLYYEIQDLAFNDFIDPNSAEVRARGNWITVPDSSLAAGTLYGSVILPFDISSGSLPDRYIRVVCAEQGALLPRNTTMANSLMLLGGQTGRPALPQNMTVTAKYDGLQTVTQAGIGVEIPMSRIVLTFDKPSVWSTYNGANWLSYRATPNSAIDPAFNILLSTLMPDASDETPSRKTVLTDGTNSVSVYLPDRQKRTIVIGKSQLSEVEGDPTRLTCELDGTGLFMDLTAVPPFDLDADPAHNENNEAGNRGPYPDFLIPNMTYYLQVFTARFEDMNAINADVWADRGLEPDGTPANGLSAALREAISYSSPILSFTTYPIREVPVPLPDLTLSVSPNVTADPLTGVLTLAGISVAYNHILKETDWRRYLSTEQWNFYDKRALNDMGVRRVSLKVEYDFSISTDGAVFVDAGKETVPYPALATLPPAHQIRSVPDPIADNAPDPGAELILPNTTYYVKARPSLWVTECQNGTTVPDEPFTLGNTMDTAVKTLTTPKLDLVSLDNITRNPRAPTEFSMATDADGNPRLTDASVVMQWMHREADVGYEMIVTSVIPPPASDPTDPELASDPQLVDFLTYYRTQSPDLVSGGALYIPLNNAAARTAMASGDLKLTLDPATLAVLFPMKGFLEPNTQYYLSLRAVRNRGTLVNGVQTPPPSRWVTVPVTTPLVKGPEQFEVVRDLEIGFTVLSNLPKGDPSNFEIYMKKTSETDSAYVKLSRDRYSLVRNAGTGEYHWRVLGLQSDTWYDFRLRHIPPDAKWYDAATATWMATPGKPVTRKTRDALHEVEVRWEGEHAYTYSLEARTADEVDYTRLVYSGSGVSDYGYEDAAGGRIDYYQEQSNAQLRENPNKYMYYARITRKKSLQRDGTFQQVPLATNTTYFVRLWASNPAIGATVGDDGGKADSIHVGPVSTRTDFSQSDYDQAKDKENIISLYDEQAEELNRKPYWLVDKGANNAVRVLLKGDRVQAMLESDPGGTQIITLDKENDNAVLYEVTVPEQVLETIHRVDGRLAVRIGGAEYLLSRSSFNLPALRAQVASSQVGETMLRIRIARRDAGDVALPSLYERASKVYGFSVETIGSRYTRGVLEKMIDEILNNPLAKGPFKYGIVDRERGMLDKNASAYTYRVHTDLLDTVGGMVGRVETEMSRYLKDILDGGSGVTAFSVQKAAVNAFPGAILARLNYAYLSGRILPLILPAGTSTWKEPAGMRAFTDSQGAFRLDGPGSMVIVSAKGVQGTSAIAWPGLTAIAGKYDLTYAFGTKPIYPTNTVTGREAVLLYELLSERTTEAQGLTMAQKLALLGLGDVIQTRTLLIPVDNQRAVSWSVQLYAGSLGKPVEQIKTVRTPAIANLSEVLPKLQKPVVLGLDMSLAALDARKRFDAKGTASVGSLLEMAQKVLTLLGK